MLTMINAVAEMPLWFVCVMGMGTVFVGLVCLIVLCSLIGLACRGAGKKEQAVAAPATPAAQPIENRQEIVAAVSAAIAEDLGKDVSAIRILSFKKK